MYDLLGRALPTARISLAFLRAVMLCMWLRTWQLLEPITLVAALQRYVVLKKVWNNARRQK
jgi:hypothetical protein